MGQQPNYGDGVDGGNDDDDDDPLNRFYIHVFVLGYMNDIQSQARIFNRYKQVLVLHFADDITVVYSNLLGRGMYVTVAHHLCRVLRRLISLNQIWLSVAVLLQKKDSISMMLSDWRSTNAEQICSEVAFGIKRPESKHVMLTCEYN
jgi:hypothetical protein